MYICIFSCLTLLQIQVIIVVHLTYSFPNKRVQLLTYMTIIMITQSKYIYNYKTFLQQMIANQDRYCQEAVNSVKNVEFCPKSKTEWDRAATKKNCGRIAPQQNCVSAEKFKYHCVINGYRNKLVEVCAPTRIIFGSILAHLFIFNYFYYILLLEL